MNIDRFITVYKSHVLFNVKYHCARLAQTDNPAVQEMQCAFSKVRERFNHDTRKLSHTLYKDFCLALKQTKKKKSQYIYIYYILYLCSKR